MSTPTLSRPPITLDAGKSLVEQRLDRVISDAIANGGDPNDQVFWDALRLHEGGSQDFIRFDPCQVRIKRGRIKLPGIGWMRIAEGALPPRDTELTAVELRRAGDGWAVHIEGEPKP